MREDKTCRFVKTEQTLFVTKDKVVVRRFLAYVRTALCLGVYHLPLLVN